MDNEPEPNAYRIDTGEPVYNITDASLDDAGGYEPPFERAQTIFESAKDGLAGLVQTGEVSKAEATAMQFQQAQVEMLTALHEVAERIERNTREHTSTSETAISALLERITQA